jgi:hypothetical protein
MHLAHVREVLRGKAELGQDLLMRNALAAIKGGADGGDLASLFFRDWLIIYRSIGKATGHGIGHNFEQVNDGGNLAGSQTLNEIMGLPLFVAPCHKFPYLRYSSVVRDPASHFHAVKY